MLMWYGGQEALNKTVVLSVLQKSALGQQQQHGGGGRGCPLVGYASSQGRAHGPGKVSSVRLSGHVVHTLSVRYCIVGGSCHKHDFCRDKHILTQTCVCRDKTRLLSREKYLVAANIFLSQQNVCHDTYLLAQTLLLSRQAYFCHETRLLS